MLFTGLLVCCLHDALTVHTAQLPAKQGINEHDSVEPTVLN